MSHDLMLRVKVTTEVIVRDFFLKCGKFDELSRKKNFFISKISYKFRKKIFFGLGFLLNVWAFIDNWAFIDKR